MTTTALPLTHFDAAGQAHMVDVAGKTDTRRVARAAGTIRMRPATLALIRAGDAKKGDVIGIARIAAIQGAKRTAELIPLCHPIAITRIAVEFELADAAHLDPSPGPAQPGAARAAESGTPDEAEVGTPDGVNVGTPDEVNVGTPDGTQVGTPDGLDAAGASAAVRCTAQVECVGKTGVEMEALTAVQVGLLTIYDMCKAADRGMTITDVRLLEKRGGKSGDWSANG